MIQTSGNRRTRDFSHWLRTGRLPTAVGPDGLELKFNPWHDPNDGRFTFAQSGRSFAAGSSEPPGGAARTRGENDPTHRGGETRVRNRANPNSSPIKTMQEADAWRAEQLERYGDRSTHRAAIEARYQRLKGTLQVRPNAVEAFTGGVGEGLLEVGKQAGKAAYSAVTTNPLTTARETIDGVADMIDTALAAEDTPARIQIARAADNVANASARDIGKAVATVAGNGVLIAAPGAGLARVAALRRLRMARPRPGPFPSPKIEWVKENLGKESAATIYNDAATGARAGQAPVLRRTMPDGSKRPVKFDGVQGETLIDRKLKVVDRPRARDQLLRQAQVLREHRLVGVWEVTSPKMMYKARVMFKKYNVTNIRVRIVKP